MKRIKDRFVESKVQYGTFLIHLEIIWGRRGYITFGGKRFPTFQDFRLDLRRGIESETTPVLDLVARWIDDDCGYVFEEEDHDLLSSEIALLAPPPLRWSPIYLAVLCELEKLLTANYSPQKRKLR